MRLDLEQDLRIGTVARHLRGVVNIRDPFARRGAYHRAGVAVAAADDHAAAELDRKRRTATIGRPCRHTPVAVLRIRPIDDDLVERMAEGLALAAGLHEVALDDPTDVDRWLIGAGCYGREPTRADLTAAAIHRAHAKLARLRDRAARRARLAMMVDRAGDVVGLVLLILGWTAAYCVACPPARAATARSGFAGESFDAFMCIAAALLFAAFVAAVYWWDTGRPIAANDDEAALDLAPETMPEAGSFLRTPRDRRS